MTFLREKDRLITTLVTDSRLNDWLYPLIASYGNWQQHLQTRARTGSTRETEFLAHQAQLQKLERMLLDFAQALVTQVATNQTPHYYELVDLLGLAHTMATQALRVQYEQTINYFTTEQSLLTLPPACKFLSLDLSQGVVSFQLVGSEQTLDSQVTRELVTSSNHNNSNTTEIGTGVLAELIVTTPTLLSRYKAITSIINKLVTDLMPWRKGPYQFLTTSVDAEWRSDMKWQRIIPFLDLQGKYVLDVGTGNGYHTWYMQQAGAAQVLAVEPYELFNTQHTLAAVLAKFAQVASDVSSVTATSATSVVASNPQSSVTSTANRTSNSVTNYTSNNSTEIVAHDINSTVNPTSFNLVSSSQATINSETEVIAPLLIPMPLSQVPSLRSFDMVFSMGVLYHRKDPLVFLEELASFLSPKAGSTLVLETLVVPGNEHYCLCLNGKYAGMANVYFIPSTDMLCQWLRMVGFKTIQVVDSTYTTPVEQRSTPLSSPLSLKDFLTADASQTIEGHPAPLRVTILASKS